MLNFASPFTKPIEINKTAAKWIAKLINWEQFGGERSHNDKRSVIASRACKQGERGLRNKSELAKSLFKWR